MKSRVPECAAAGDEVHAAAVRRHPGGPGVIERAEPVVLIAAIRTAWDIAHKNRSFRGIVYAKGAIFIEGGRETQSAVRFVSPNG